MLLFSESILVLLLEAVAVTVMTPVLVLDVAPAHGLASGSSLFTELVGVLLLM